MKVCTQNTYKVIILCLMVCISFSILNGCKSKSKLSQEKKIGAILPLTGDAAIYGQEIKNGIDLAVEEFNRKGTNSVKLKIIYEDDAGSAKIGVSAVTKLIKIDKVPVIIGGAMSSVAMSIAPITQKENTVLLSPTATAPSLSNIGKFFFRIWPSDNYDGTVMADYAYNKLKLRTFSILYVNTDYGKGIEEVFKNKITNYGGLVIYSESYEIGSNDFKTQLTKIKTLNPDALYLPGYYKELAGILRQIKELGIKSRILSVNSFYDPRLIEIAGNAAEEATFTYPFFDVDSSDPTIKNFVTNFQKQYGKKPDAFAVQGYDALRIVAKSIEEGGFTKDGIQKAMSAIKDFQGVGGKMSFDEHGDVIKHLSIFTVENGKFIQLKDINYE